MLIHGKEDRRTSHNTLYNWQSASPTKKAIPVSQRGGGGLHQVDPSRGVCWENKCFTTHPAPKINFPLSPFQSPTLYLVSKKKYTLVS